MYRNATLSATRATAWQEGDTHWLLLESRVRVEVGGYGFSANRAVVRIESSQDTGSELALYLDKAQPLPGRGPTTAQADRLLVTALVDGELALRTDALLDDPAAIARAKASPLLADALVRYTRYDETPREVAPQAPAETSAIRTAELPRSEPTRFTEADPTQDPRPEPTQTFESRPAVPIARDPTLEPRLSPPVAPVRDRVLPARGIVSFHADPIVVQRGVRFEKPDGMEGDKPGDKDSAETLDAVILMGGGRGVQVVYQDYTNNTTLTLRAEAAVVFVQLSDPAGAAPGSVEAAAVKGIYLEDHAMVSDGNYTVRGPRMFFDPSTNQALVLDAVLSTWDDRQRLPLYLRAAQLRQWSKTRYAAWDARLTTSEFGVPHFAIGASRLTLESRTPPGGEARPYVTSVHNTARWGDVPVFYWPYLAGEAQRTPLRRISVGGDYDDELNELRVEVKTDWDALALLGIDAPPGVDANLGIDWLDDRRIGLGLDVDYERPRMFGSFQGYLLPYDEGFDRPPGAAVIPFEGDTRGFVQFQHRQVLRDGWEASVEGAFVGDETFLFELFPEEAITERPYETSLYLKKQEGDWAFDALLRQDVIGFLPQMTTLLTPGSITEKQPELGYYRVATPLLNDRLTYYTENRVSRMRLQFGEDAPADRGLNDFVSSIVFGIPSATTSFEDAAEAAGLPTDWVHRLDSRHELQAPFRIDAVHLVPYAAGRATFYDQTFEAYAGEDDDLRLWGALGLRIHSTFSTTLPDVNSRLLDVDGMRHLFEPFVDGQLAGSTLNPEDLPTFDAEVEGISEGATIRAGARQVWQTRRGGPGRQRTVEWVSLLTEVVLRSDDAFVDRPVPRVINYRPEYTLGGDQFHAELAWMVTDALVAAGELIHDLEDGTVEQYRVGLTWIQSQRLSFSTEFIETDVFDDATVSLGASYRPTAKYRFNAGFSTRIRGDPARTWNVSIERQLPRWRLLVAAAVDDLAGDASLAVLLVPEGVKGGRLIGLPQ